MKSFHHHRLDESARRSLSRILTHMENGNVGIISASLKDRSPAENNRHTKDMEQSIKASGLAFFRRHGQYEGPSGTEKERSFVVLGKKGDDHGQLLNLLKTLGKAHNQHSILHKAHNSNEAYLHFLQNDGTNKEGDTMSVGKFHPNHINPYGHTVLSKGGGKLGKTPASHKTFAFEEITYGVQKSQTTSR